MRIESFKLAGTAGKPKDDDRFGARIVAVLGCEGEELTERREPRQAGHASHFEESAARKMLRATAGAVVRIERFHNLKIAFSRDSISETKNGFHFLSMVP